MAKRSTSRSFWKKPEGKTGLLVLLLLIGGAAMAVSALLPTLIMLTTSFINLAIGGVVLLALLSVFAAPKSRALIWYGFKSAMRWLTGFFVKVDPMAILNAYVEDLEENISTMKRQIAKLRGQMHLLNESIYKNNRQIRENLEIASKARDTNDRSAVILRSRKAGRLKESNLKLEDLYKKMEVMYRVLTRMFENSSILKEDIKDQVRVKEQERRAIHASHTAMQSARSVIKGSPDQRAMFDRAMEAIKDDVAGKVGEMERFMELSANFMDSIDLQNGIFEEEGLRMLEEWEREGDSLLLGSEKNKLISEAEDDSRILDLNQPLSEPSQRSGRSNQYDAFFD